MNEWNGWQIPHTGVAANAENEHVRNEDDVVTPFRRKSDMRISNFGALWVSPRMDADYTRTVLTFESKDDYSNWKLAATDDGAGGLVGLRGTVVDNNPYLWGSTVKKVRDDQFFRMDMDNNVDGIGIDKPKFDVMDTNVVQSGMNQYKNYPTEGWRSFGGKYDFLPYTGVLGRPRGNGSV
jgi:hypothetical protein